MGWPAWSVLRLGSDEWAREKTLRRTFLLHLLLVLGSFALVATPALEAREAIDRYVHVPGATGWVLGYALLSALGLVIAAFLRPAQRLGRFAFLPLTTRVFWVGALGLAAWAGRTLEAWQVIGLCTLTAIPQVLVGLALVGGWVLPPALPDGKSAERALHFGLPVLFRQLGIVAFANVNFAVLMAALGEEKAARFQVVFTLAEQAAILAVALDDIMGPILAGAAVRGEEATLATYYRTLAPQVVLAWSTVCGLVLVLAGPILGLMSVRAVEASTLAFQVLLLATAVRVIVSLEAPVFDAHLISRSPLLFFVVGFLANLGLDLLLIPRWGIEGAACATLAGWTLNTVLRSVYLRARFRVRALGLYASLLPVAAAFAWARLGGGGGLGRDAVAAFALTLGTLVAGRLLGSFSPETLEALEGVRMPASLRRALAWAYGAPRRGGAAGGARGGAPGEGGTP